MSSICHIFAHLLLCTVHVFTLTWNFSSSSLHSLFSCRRAAWCSEKKNRKYEPFRKLCLVYVPLQIFAQAKEVVLTPMWGQRDPMTIRPCYIWSHNKIYVFITKAAECCSCAWRNDTQLRQMGAVCPQLCANVHLFERQAEMYVHVSNVCPDVTRSVSLRWACATRGCKCTHWEGHSLIRAQIT